MANVKEVPKLAQLPTPITADKLLLRMGIYGEGGVGKTKLALSFPKPLVEIGRASCRERVYVLV